MSSMKDCLAFYRSRHRTPGCKLTHLIGLPALVATPFCLLFRRDKKLGVGLLLLGLFMQFAGHFFFEKNKPTLIESGDPKVIPASLIFIWGEWLDVFSGQWIRKNGLNLWAKGDLELPPGR